MLVSGSASSSRPTWMHANHEGEAWGWDGMGLMWIRGWSNLTWINDSESGFFEDFTIDTCLYSRECSQSS